MKEDNKRKRGRPPGDESKFEMKNKMGGKSEEDCEGECEDTQKSI
jgi:hypothetical protein